MIGRLLCRLHLHSWVFIAPDLTGYGCFEACKRCKVASYFCWASGGVRSYDVDPNHPLLKGRVFRKVAP